MSADNRHADATLTIAVLWGLFGCAGVAVADDEAMPDIEFLEYLGSWEESDADWVLFSDTETEQLASDVERTDPVSKDEESVETDDES